MVGIEGDPLAPPPEATLLNLSPKQSVLLFGLIKRKENDAEVALTFAHNHSDNTHKTVVLETNVLMSGEKITLENPLELMAFFPKLEKGEVLVTETLARVYERLFLFETVFQKGEHLYYLEGIRRRPARLRGLQTDHAPLIGRHKEIERMQELLEQVQVDQGQILGLVGEGGIGKTRLTQKLKSMAESVNIPTIEGTNRIGGIAFEGVREVVQKLTQNTLQTLSRWNMTESEMSYLQIFLNHQTQGAGLKNLSEEQIKEGSFLSVRKLLHEASKHTPLVIILEDLHWAGKETLDLLEFVINGMEKTKLLLVTIFRPTFVAPWKKNLNYTELNLTPLSTDESNDFVKTVLGIHHIDHEALKNLFTNSLGNPFFLEELLRQAQFNKTIEVVTDTEGHKTLNFKSKIGDVPTTIYSLVAARFDTLDAKTKDALRWATILGSHGNTDELEGLLDIEMKESGKAFVQKLLEEEFLVEKTAFPTRTHTFRHDLFYEVITSTLSKEETQKRHHAVAKFLKDFYKNSNAIVGRLAFHFFEGGAWPEATEYSLKAGHEANDKHLYVESLKYFENAAVAWEKFNGKKPNLELTYEPYVNSLISTGDLNKAAEVLDKWKDNITSTQSSSKTRLSILLTKYHYALSEYENALTSSERALESIQELEDKKKIKLELATIRAFSLRELGRIDELSHEATEDVKLAKEYADKSTELILWLQLAIAANTKNNYTLAESNLTNANSLLNDSIPPSTQIEFFMRASKLKREFGDLNSAKEYAIKAVTLSKSMGLKKLYINSIEKLADYYALTGDLSSTLSTLKQLYKETKEIGDHHLLTWAQIYIADTLCDCGEFDEAENIISKLNITKENSAIFSYFQYHYVVGFLALCKTDYLSAYNAFQKNVFEAEKLNDSSVEKRYQLRSIWAQAEGRLKDISALEKQYFDIIKDIPDQKNYLFWTSKFIGFVLLSKGSKINSKPLTELAIEDCVYPDLRQLINVYKIRYYDFIKDTVSANQLRQSYKNDREEISKSIPPEYKAHFYAHPIYKTP